MVEKEPSEPPRYYDVEKFHKVYLETLKARKGIRKIIGRIGWRLDSMQGFYITMLGPAIAFGSALAVIIGISYGPFAFLGIFGSIIGGLSFVVDRKVGRSLQFEEYKLWRRTLAQGLAFFLATGAILFLVFLSRIRLF